MADRVGQQLDNYRLVRLLGVGGFGQVYLAEHIYRTTQPSVAIKILPPLAQDDLRGFLTEARTFRLKHPNIVQVLDFGVEGRIPFIAMEYAPNGTLRQRHPKGTRVPLPIIVSYVKQVASSLQYAHDERLVHRDVKPENMLIGAQNQVLLSDFGIATIAHGTSSQSGEVMAGTIPYMAPEQIQAHPRPASDQYSLGVVVYEWLCGDRPFQGTLTEVAVKHATVPPPPLREKVLTISPDVEQVVMTALAKDPKQRFGSIQAFATALEQVGQVEPTETLLARRPSQPTNAMTARSETQQPTELVSRPGESSIPTEMIVPLAPPKAVLLPTQPVGPPPSTQAPPAVRPQGVLPTQRAATPPPNPSLVSTQAGGGAPQPVSPFTSLPQKSIGLVSLSAQWTQLCTYSDHAKAVQSLAWSPDGAILASGGNDKTVQVWNAITGSTIFTYRGHSGVIRAVAWSVDGKWIAS
jgi:eukaryotic-like serine/threonine-protein kinase